MPIADKMRNLFGLGSSGPSNAQKSPALRQPTPVQKSSKPAPARPTASAATRAAAEAAERRRLQPRVRLQTLQLLSFAMPNFQWEQHNCYG